MTVYYYDSNTVNGNGIAAVNLDALTPGSNNRVIVEDDAAIVNTLGGAGLLLSTGSNSFEILGTVAANNNAGLLATGGNCHFFVGAGGLVTGNDYGLQISAGGNYIENHGTISGGSSGATYAAIGLFTTAGAENTFVNFGSIIGERGGAAIAASGVGAVENVINHGWISGPIKLAAGNDSYDGTDGRVQGAIGLGDGDDIATGGAAIDVIIGGNGYDILDGGGGNDRFLSNPGDGHDDIDGGDGVDTYVASNNASIINLNAGLFASAFDGISEDILRNIENATGGNLNDLITGSGGRNILSGGAGQDVILGGGGHDGLLGGAHADTITGGTGRDILIGGGQPDTFVYEEVSASPVGEGDIIRDFTDGGGADQDKIDFSAIDANVATPGNESFTLLPTIGSSFTPGVPGQLRYYQLNGSTYIEGQVDGGDADFQIQLIGLYNNFTTADIIL